MLEGEISKVLKLRTDAEKVGEKQKAIQRTLLQARYLGLDYSARSLKPRKGRVDVA